MIQAILILLLAMVVIWRASDGFETASEYLGRNLTDGVRGATINAIGSSMPELFTTFFGLLLLQNTDNFAFGIGTTAGSAVFNAMIIPAVVILAVIGSGMALKVNVSRKVILRDGLSLLAAELIFVVSGSRLDWWHGAILMATYGAYVVIMFRTMGSGEEEELDEFHAEDMLLNRMIRKVEEEEDEAPETWWKALFSLDMEALIVGRSELSSGRAWVLLSMCMTVIGVACVGLVQSCEEIAGSLGMAPYFIAVVLASAATSVPDTILSYRDAMNGEYDDAVANALGSNIFDVCFALGLPLFVYTIVFSPIEMPAETVTNVAELRVSLFILTALAFCIFYFNKGMGVLHAVVLLLIYVAFTVFVLSKAYDVKWAVDLGQFLQSIISNKTP